MKHEKRYYKIGEFAEMCGTKKSTLQHYARVGVLQPALIGENGYFYYELSQIYIFEAIYAMRVMQIPLEEIKEYLAGNLCRCSGYEGQLRGIQAFLEYKKGAKL